MLFRSEWKEAFEGMNAMEVSISVSLPEFDGVVHGVPIATKSVLENGDVRYLSIPERIVRIVDKAKKWAALRHKENGEKKIAIIFHNYPPKNSNIGSGVGLDTIESVRRMLANMREKGYKVDFIPKDTKEFINILTSHATNDRSLLSAKQLEEANKISGGEYGAFYDTFEEKVQAQLEKDWGKAPGTVMEYNGKLMVPGTMDGNVFITVQPPRGYPSLSGILSLGTGYLAGRLGGPHRYPWFFGMAARKKRRAQCFLLSGSFPWGSAEYVYL